MTFGDLAILLGALLVVGGCAFVVQKRWPPVRRQEHNYVTGSIFHAVATLYAVLLAFVVIGMWQNLGTARQGTYTEADQLASIYWLSRCLPLSHGAAIEALTLDYAHTVIDKEWPLMSDRNEISPEATDLVSRIRGAVFGFVPRSEQQGVLYQQAVISASALTAARRDRINEMGGMLPGLLWAVLIIGAVITVGFCMLFGLGNQVMHISMVVMLAGLIVISLLLIKNMEQPFTGSIRIGPDAFELFLSHLPPPR